MLPSHEHETAKIQSVRHLRKIYVGCRWFGTHNKKSKGTETRDLKSVMKCVRHQLIGRRHHYVSFQSDIGSHKIIKKTYEK